MIPCLKKTLHLILGKLLIVGGLKEPYSAIVGCWTVAFGIRGKIIILHVT
jgi:hypothetical protein